MRLQTILFDVDGTLVDSNDLHVQAWLEAFSEFGVRIESSAMHSQIGKGGDLLVPDLLDARQIRSFGEELKKRRSALFKEKYLPQVKPFPGTRELFEKLAERGVKMALASSSDPGEVEYYTRLLGVGELIEATTSKGDAEVSKPSPDIFRAALEQAGADAERTMVVGDTPYDVLAAHRIALPVVAVLSGGFDRESLAKAEFLLGRATEIPGRIDELNAWFE